ncbi:hypothetical protein GCM10010207_81700 [Streptomyces atratus]|nr:hypothetical protein GCM10010207_81700 [Streptomyces atratus]
MSTGEAAGEGAGSAAAVAEPADDTVPTAAAAASAAVSMVLREVGLFMGETPGRKRNGAANARQWANYCG